MSPAFDMLPPDLRAAVASARAAWPDLSLGEEAFAEQVAELVAEQPTASWTDLHLGDLYLARACAAGDGKALVAFEHRMWPEIDGALARVGLPRDKREDVMQDLRLGLLVGVGAAPARITQYRGRGELRRWLRAAALRDAFRLVKRARRDVELDDVALAALAVLDRDVGLAHLRDSCRVELKRAFEAALGALGRRERTLLRQHHLDGLSIDDLAALHHVHRATAARWLVKAREELNEAVLAGLRQRLRVDERELQSLLELVRSQLDVSMDRLLRVGT